MNCANIEPGQFLCSTCANRNASDLHQCPGRWFFHHFGDKWTLPVLGALHSGPLRFSQLRKSLTPISERMLILSLKELENGGLICREIADAYALHSTYQMTPVGRSLLDHLRDLFLWMNDNAASILAAYASDEAIKSEPDAGRNTEPD